MKRSNSSDGSERAKSPWTSDGANNFVIATPGEVSPMPSDEEADPESDQEGDRLPARCLAETSFKACALGGEGFAGDRDETRPWSTARIRKRPGMTRAEIAEAEAAMLLSARHECSVRELVQIHRRELMESLLERITRNAVDGQGSTNSVLYVCTRADASAAWQYEHIRAFSNELSELAVSLKDVCTFVTCPQMKATDEWMYLCAAHKTPRECCAIDYIVHTLDGTAALLNSNKWFPREGAINEASIKYFQSITRRLYRILSHCYFHHRDVFDLFEVQRHLCFRFVRFAEEYDLIPHKLLIIPHDAFHHR